MKITRVFAKKAQRIAPVPANDKTTSADGNIPRKHLVTRSYDRPSVTQSTSSCGSASEHNECPTSSHPHRPSRRPSRRRQSSAQQSSLDALDSSYRVVSKLAGRGVSGEVRPCVHRATREPCAVKTIDKSRVRRQDRIRREIDFLSEVDHPSIIKLRDVYEDRESVHIVTEMCRGGELFDEIVKRAKLGKRNPGAMTPCFDEAAAVPIIRSLIESVSYLHKHDIVHRDIKPENILFVDKDDVSRIKLIDFGLSIRHKEGAPPLRNIVGTSYYMDPALLEGAYDRSCDLWSVGVICYVMLSGRPPFNGATDDAIFEKIRRGHYTMSSGLWKNISDEAKDFIRCLLVKERSKRWTADAALQHPWLRQRC